MKKIFYCLLFSLVLLFNVHVATAQELEKPVLDIKAADKTLEVLNKRILENKMSLLTLTRNAQVLTQLRERATECTDRHKKSIEKIKKLLEKLDTYLEASAEGPDYATLKEKAQQAGRKLAQCEIFKYKSDQVLSRYKDAMQALSLSTTLERSVPIWKIFDFTFFETLNLKDINVTGLFTADTLSDTTLMGILGSLLVSVLLAFAIYLMCAKKLAVAETRGKFQLHSINMLKRYVLFFLPILTLSVGLQLFFQNVAVGYTVNQMVYAALLFVMALFLTDFLLFMPTMQAEHGWTLAERHTVSKRFKVTLSLIFFTYMVSLISSDKSVPIVASELSRTFFITAISISVLWLSFGILQFSIFSQEDHALLRRAFKSLAIGIFLFMIIAEWTGFHNLSVYLIRGLLLSAIYITFALSLINLLEKFYYELQEPNGHYRDFINKYLGVKSHRKLPEVMVIRIALYLVILSFSIWVLMNIWRFTTLYIEAVRRTAIEGFTLFNITILPTNIIVALFTFGFISLLGRFWAHYIGRRNHADAGDVQLAITSILNYIVFSLALLVALLIAGVNFTGLAIIAGALSVGIGFGLQNLVNNFICGLVLLIQKPIKSGDRVFFDNREGYIKKVRILSTQIQTQARDDILVPNSDLIFKPLTNFMFRDRLWRVTCEVGVAYGSDTDLVRKTLLEVAESHPGVATTGRNKPRVLFRAFADSSLTFQLWAIIKNVNEKNDIQSDLNFAIDKAFREQGITIAFPQRDVHILDHRDKGDDGALA